MNSNKLYVVYSTDDNYSQHTGVSIISLLDNNSHFYDIEIFIIDNEISDINKGKLISISNKYGRKINFIDFSKYKNRLNLNMAWQISISAYARLFISTILPNHIDKVIYFDCDTIISRNLDDLWNENIDNYMVAGVHDTVNNNTKEAIGISAKAGYINSGVLLINLKKWRSENIEDKFMKFIESYNGKVIHHDQGVINAVLSNSIKILSPKFNLMTVYYTMTRQDIIRYYGIEGNFYSDKEINDSINNVVTIHFTPGFTTRPWIRGCKHPKKDIYWNYLQMSPWCDYKLQKDNSKIHIKIVNWIYRNLKLSTAQKIISLLFK